MNAVNKYMTVSAVRVEDAEDRVRWKEADSL